jgi:hypothetical protein
MIHFDCPTCGQTFQVKDEHAGRRTNCPKCHQGIQVPAAQSPAIKAGAPSPSSASQPDSFDFVESPSSSASNARTSKSTGSGRRMWIALCGGGILLVIATIGVTPWAAGVFSKPTNGKQSITQGPNAEQPSPKTSGKAKPNIPISGELFVTTNGGDVKKAAGLRLYFTPATPVLRDIVKTTVPKADQIEEDSHANFNKVFNKYLRGVSLIAPEYKAREKAYDKEMDEYSQTTYTPHISPLLKNAENALRRGVKEAVSDGDGKFKVELPADKYLLWSDKVFILKEELSWCKAFDAQASPVHLILNQDSVVFYGLDHGRGLDTHRLLRVAVIELSR